MNRVSTNGAGTYNGGPQEKALKRYKAVWDFSPCKNDEMELNKGDTLLVADEFPDGWMRGLRLGDLEIGFFPSSFVAEDSSPIYNLRELNGTTTEHFSSELEPKIIETGCSKRSKIAFEIFSSEDVYLQKLRMLNEKFVVPLRGNTAVIIHEDYHPVFSNIQPLLSLADSLIMQLKSRMEGWDDRYTRIGDIFMHMGHHMKLFMTYAVQHTLGSQVLIKISAQDKFRTWLEKSEVECKRTLNSLLLEPIQRVPRYEMLLKDLFKHTSENHPDYTTLKEALNFMQKIASDCNENIRRAESELKLFAITKRFPHDEVEVVPARWITRNGKLKGEGGTLKKKKRLSENSLTISRADSTSMMSVQSFFESEHRRVFVREGVVSKTKQDFTDPTEKYLILCSDVLLVAQSSSRGRKSFKLKERVMLVHAWVTDTGSLMAQQTVPERGFILGTPLKVYHFLAPTLEEKNMWFQELQSRIFTQKRLFNELLSHLSIPDENFESMKVKAKVGYLGMLQDELSFKSGDDISIVGFQSSGKWKPGLYSQEPFDPSPEWYFGTLKENYGWFPMQCVMGIDGKPLEPLEEELEPTPMCIVLGLKQRMIELTGRVVPPLTETERTAKVFTGEGNFKTLRIPPQCVVDDIVRMYFKVKPDCQLAWSLLEQSADGTVLRPLDPSEEPSEVVDFWGKTRDRMRFILKQSVINLEVDEIEDTEA